jgi:hypothetical protein
VENGLPRVTKKDCDEAAKYFNFQEFCDKNPGKIYWLELNEQSSSMICENLASLRKNFAFRRLVFAGEKAQSEEFIQERRILEQNGTIEFDPLNVYSYSYVDFCAVDMSPECVLGAVSGCSQFATNNPGQRIIMTVAHQKKVIQEQVPGNEFF